MSHQYQQHSMSCSYPEGCNCGASAWNQLLHELNYYKNLVQELEEKLKNFSAATLPSERKQRIIHQLAQFLAADQAGKSIALQFQRTIPGPANFAKDWAAMREAVGLVGYHSVEEVEAELRRLLQ